VGLASSRRLNLNLSIDPSFFEQNDSGLLRILDEHEWRGVGITQSPGWQHFEVHGECRELRDYKTFMNWY
jgi:cyclin-dependent kinase regulatory subunit CKS1